MSETQDRASNWMQATQLRCPHCGAANRPGATYIERQPNGLALCIVCSKTFDPRRV